MAAGSSVTYRVCTLCEATCGIAVTTEGGRVLSVRGDPDDPFSRGYICPKAHALKELGEDPDRLRRPLVRRDGVLVEASWEEAFAAAVDGLLAVRERHGRGAIGAYAGNPVVHGLGTAIYTNVLLRALGSKSRFSASSVDQLPKMLTAAAMFGGPLTVAVPDLDRTEYLLVLGANPRASNGSLMTAPGVGRRLDAILARGGRVVVVDPRRTETAEKASEHVSIRPGGDAAFVLSLAEVVVREGLARPGRLAELARGEAEARAALSAFTPERTQVATGIDPATVRRLARELAAAPRAAVYGRLGTTCQEFGTLASWAVDLLNYLTGNLDREGGVMFPLPAALRGGAKQERGVDRSVARLGERRSRIGGLPYLFGELPAATIADEILTPGEGQLRALVTVAGNPARSVPGSARIEEALASLEHLVCVDFYLNETTRHASVILPPPAPLERETYDLAFYQLAVRNVAKYSLAAVPRPADQPDEWQILLTLAAGLLGLREAPLEVADGIVFSGLVDEELSGGELRFPGLGADEARAALGEEPGPRRILDLWLRTGPYGDGFGRNPGGLSLARLLESPHGVDLGPLTPGLPALLQTADRRIDLFPPVVAGDLPRLAASLDRPAAGLVLIGRRHLRSNNSWLHNVRSLAKGPERCTVLMHPADAAGRGLVDGGLVRVSSRVGAVVAPLETTDAMRRGVVSLPHGFGHDAPGTRLSLAGARPGANVNQLTDPARLDLPSGNAALNGEPVSVTPA